MKFLDYIKESFDQSMIQYDHSMKSQHWKKYDNRKDLFNIESLKNFRKNNLSEGLDDIAPNLENLKLSLKLIIDKCGKEFVFNNLSKNNIGSNEYYMNFDDCFSNNFLYEIKENCQLHVNDMKIICEIGGGYGQLAKIIRQNLNAKILLIDLPEANFMSTYFLTENFPDLKFLLYSKTNQQFIDEKIIKDYDIIILPPWMELNNIKIDLFINTRSMMEMNLSSIDHYFSIINKHIKLGGFFVNVNRYIKNTVGTPVQLCDYPYDNHWEVISSKSSWKQAHIHQLITQRVEYPNNSIKDELNKIKILQKKYNNFFMEEN